MLSFTDQTIKKFSLETPNAIALTVKGEHVCYQALYHDITRFAAGLAKYKLTAGTRVGIYLPKRLETIVSIMGCNAYGATFVIINPVLKPAQVDYIVKHCQIQLLISHKQRLEALSRTTLKTIKHIVSVDASNYIAWQDFLSAETAHIRHDNELACIIYTSGSTGQPKGVMVSNNNLLVGARAVAKYLQLNSQDRLLALLPLSFDYGLNQLTSAFYVGARAVLLDYLLPKDVVKICAQEKITGLAAVPPLWIKLANLEWPEHVQQTLRLITNSGGAMPEAILQLLLEKLPSTRPYLMYGLTEAFRSTYLEPTKVKHKPTSIGQAIPDATVLVLNEQGQPTEAYEHGQLVHLGPLVTLGYWADQERTERRYKAVPGYTTLGVYSGDRVYRDNDGDIFFVAREDEMIKSSGYRISPDEIESVAYEISGVNGAIACGVNDNDLGQAIVLAIACNDTTAVNTVKKTLKKNLPFYMQPKHFIILEELPKNANGKIDRSSIVSNIKRQVADYRYEQ